MQLKLRTRLSLSFLLVTLLMLALVSFLANVILTSQFRAYAISKQTQQIEDVVSLLDSRYADWNGQWDLDGLESIGVSSLNEGLLLRIKDGQGMVLWDAHLHNSGMCSAIIANFAETMEQQTPGFQGGYTEASFPLIQGAREVGRVEIGYYGPYSYTAADVAFLSSLNRLLLTAALVAMLASLTLGAVMARQMTRPITRVIEATRSLAEGRFGEPIAPASSTTEIRELTASVNSLAETLGQQENLRRQLVSDVAHELRTPITILQSHLEAMIDGTWPADEQHLEGCHGEAVRIARLVGDLTKLTQLEQGNLVLQYEPVAVMPLLQRIADNFQREFELKQVALRVEGGAALEAGAPAEGSKALAGDVPAEADAADQGSSLTVAADADKLSQAVINLVTNALKYTNPGGTVTLAADDDETSLWITVRDTGIGIAPEDLPHIFERFYRTDKSRARQTGGSGIGLTIARSIIEAHGGTLTAESEPGRGSTFTIRIPRAA